MHLKVKREKNNIKTSVFIYFHLFLESQIEKHPFILYMHKILLIEDEQNVADFIIQGLEEDDYTVVHVKKYSDALRKLEKEAIDLVLLDVLLPEMNGLDICKNLREQNYRDLPILMVTALGSPENVVLGLDSGADDYLSKPFKLIELKARIRSLIRRKKEMAVSKKQEENKNFHYQFITIDDYKKVAYCHEQEMNLTSTEYRLLLLFIQNPKKGI